MRLTGALVISLMMLDATAVSAQVARCSDGSWQAGQACTRCPDGSYTAAPACQRTPTGTWVGDYGRGLRRTPDNKWIPEGVGVVQCRDGHWYAGQECVFLPDQRWGGAVADKPTR
jgi:hypothetical protein